MNLYILDIGANFFKIKVLPEKNFWGFLLMLVQ